MSNMKRVHVFISGRVQFVNFRYYTREKANSLGLNGWVKNLDDGRVEAVFEGDNNKIEEILKYCRKGPLLANVKDVNVIEEEPKGETNFEIIREFKKII